MKRQRRLTYDQAMAYFVTATVSDFTDLLCEDGYAQIILRNLDFYREKFGFRLLAYVVMPQHIHLVLQTSSKGNVSEIMRDFKKRTAKEIVKLLKEERRTEVLSVFAEAAKRYHPNENRVYQVWEDRFDDVAVYSDKVLRTKIEYIHNNPVKAGLSDSQDAYLYSSARNYHCDDHSAIRVDC
ncbi:MAG: transposase [Dehalococcoidia bacterium]|nr:transposase [Dehalococcoidia bacterium]